jgi:hypothetical protein
MSTLDQARSRRLVQRALSRFECRESAGKSLSWSRRYQVPLSMVMMTVL